MYVSTVRTFLLILLFKLRISRSSIIPSRPYNRVAKSDGTSRKSNNVHNVTVDCGDPGVLRQTVSQCQRDISHLTMFGYPWSPLDSQSNFNPNVTDRNNTLRDALDSLNHVCHIHERSQACLEESGIRDYCLATTTNTPVQISFQYICHHQRRDENLVHSLQCLYDTRVMAMLYFHIADRCRGFGILDDIMRRYKKIYFYVLDTSPPLELAFPPLLYCIPKTVISTCIRDIVQDHCGTMAANLAESYLFYLHHWFDEALQSVGLDSNICDSDTNSDMMPTRPPITPGHTNISISQLLEMTAPGTALDTVYGKYTLTVVRRLSVEELCSPTGTFAAYFACSMSSDNKFEKNKFSILQFAHQLSSLAYHGAQCSRLEQFTACWNLLQQTCGPTTRGLEQDATLLVEACEIQSEMDTAGCHWQDMLLGHYIQASRVTMWPTSANCLCHGFRVSAVG